VEDAVFLANLDPRVSQESTVDLASLANPVDLDHLVTPLKYAKSLMLLHAGLAHQVPLDQQVPMVPMDHLAALVPQETPAALDNLVPKAQLDPKDNLDSPEPKDALESPVAQQSQFPTPLVSLDHKANPDHRDNPANRDPPDNLAALEIPDPKDHPDPKVNPDHKADPANLDLKDLLAALETVATANLAHHHPHLDPNPGTPTPTHGLEPFHDSPISPQSSFNGFLCSKWFKVLFLVATTSIEYCTLVPNRVLIYIDRL
jgi:hypothetical protein